MKHIPNMKEKTLRYPGHIRLIQALKASGFLEESAIEYKGNNISPLDFTSKILFKKWKLLPNEEEFTVMKIKITGFENGKAASTKERKSFTIFMMSLIKKLKPHLWQELPAIQPQQQLT